MSQPAGENEAGTYIIISGDPMAGYDFVGPFDNAEDAIHYGDMELNNEAWWVLPLTPPTKDEDARLRDAE